MSTLLLPPGVTREALAAALAVAEAVAAKDRSNLYLASQFFADRARYDAFIAMYAVMRVIDDGVDNVQDKTRLSPAERDGLLANLDRWETRIRNAYGGGALDAPLDIALAAAVRTFPVPVDHWLAFVDAMRFDVRKPRFDDFAEFLIYGEGATVAPTAIYVYLLTSTRQPDGRYLVADFDFAGCGRELGRFAYVAHVLRDVREDLAVGATGLVYLSAADLAAHDLTEDDLRLLVRAEAPESTQACWRALVRDLCGRARAMRAEGTALAEMTWDDLPRDCAFIFHLIVEVYAELLDRIDADPDKVLGAEPVLSEDDKWTLLLGAAEATGYSVEDIHAQLAAPRDV